MRTTVLLGAMLAACVGIAAGCGSESDGDNSKGAGASTGQKSFAIGVVTGTKSDPFHIAMSCGALDAGKRLGVKVTYQAPNQYAAAQQIPIVDALAAKRPDGMVVAPTDDAALVAPLKAVVAGGAKLTLIDTGLKDASVATAGITEDYLSGGKQAADEISRLIGDSGHVLLIAQAPGITTQDNGKKGFEEGLKAHPKVKSVGTQYDGADPTKASSIVAAVLARDPQLNGIVTLNGPSAPGVINALKRAGKQDSVKFLGFDATPEQITALKAGEIAELLYWKPYEIGQLGVEKVVAALRGQSVGETEILTKPLAVTKETVDDPAKAKYFYKGC
jgi:ribose transport system substrate-binding protein